MKIYNRNTLANRFAWLLILMVCFTGREARSQESKSSETGEIVMSAAELESLLTIIAQRRKETLKKSQLYQPQPYQLGRLSAYQDPKMYPDFRSLEYKIDLLLSQSNLLPKQGTTTTINLQPETNRIAAQPTIPDTVKEVVLRTREVLKGHQVFFLNNSTLISPHDKHMIQDLIPMIKRRRNEVLVVLNGYASQVGNSFYNNQLSYNRCDTIKQLLVKNGVSPGNIMILYHGSDSTVSVEEARRVEISLELIRTN